MKNYLTLAQSAYAELVEKKSRFFADAFPCGSEEEFAMMLEEVSRKYPAAGHNCYGYRICCPNMTERFSDDGEPGQTAGLPILTVLSGQKIVNAAVVVSRIYGGTNLGTGGLVRAYGGVAKEAVALAGLVQIEAFKRYRLEIDYSSHGKLAYELPRIGVFTESTDFAGEVTLSVLAREEAAGKLFSLFGELTGGARQPEDLGEFPGFLKDGRIILK